MPSDLRIAYDQGKEAKYRGYERVSPYKKRKAEVYWYAGFDGLDYQEFNKFVKESRRKIQPSTTNT